MADAINDLEEAQRFKVACTEYSEGIYKVISFLRSSLERVGETWNDEDYYNGICGMVADIEQEIATAKRIADDEIIPYVTKVVDALSQK